MPHSTKSRIYKKCSVLWKHDMEKIKNQFKSWNYPRTYNENFFNVSDKNYKSFGLTEKLYLTYKHKVP